MPDPDMAQFTGVFRAGKPHRVKRNRQPVSCVACQRRKSKCDKRQPCGACDKRGEGDDCRFGIAVRATAGAARQEVQIKLSRLEEMIKGFAGAEGAGTGVDEESNVTMMDVAAAPRRQQQQQQPARRTKSGGMAPALSISQPPAASSAGTPITRHLARPASSSSPPSEQTDQQYHGATAWSAVVSSIQDIQHMLQADSDAESNPDADTPEEEFDQLLGHTRPIGIDEIKNSLPSKLFTDRVISCYFNAKFHAVPFIHAHQFRRQYEAFWEDPASAGFLWISLLFSVLGAGALLAKAKLAHEPGLLRTIEEPGFYLGVSARCLVAGRYLECRPGSVEALLQHAHSRNMQRQDEDRVLWALYGLAVRMAQLQGYHRDPSRLPVSVGAFEGEMRRRTWFMIQSAELLVALHSGLPPIIHEGLSDAEHPSNLLDEDFDEDTAVLPPPRPPTDPTPILAYIAKSKLSVILRRVMLHALAVRRPSYAETLRLSDQLRAWHDAQPACLRIRSIRATAFTDANYTIMHRIMLELMYRKCLCVLHRPYLTEHRADPAYDQSRATCRAAALAMLDMHVELDHEISARGRMHEDRFMVSNLTLQHFLLASTVVCVDLAAAEGGDDLSPADRTRFRAALRRSHDVWAARSAYSADARHATRILRAVLNRVNGEDDGRRGTASSSSPLSGHDVTSSSSAGMSPAMSNLAAATGLEPPLAAMNVDIEAPPPQPQLPIGSMHVAAEVPLVDCRAVQGRPLPTSHHRQQQQQQQPHMQPQALPHHLAADSTPAASQGMYYDFSTGGYMAMPEAEFPASSFSQPTDLDTLLYSTEGVNWNSIDQFLRVENNTGEQGWSHILQGV